MAANRASTVVIEGYFKTTDKFLRPEALHNEFGFDDVELYYSYWDSVEDYYYRISLRGNRFDDIQQAEDSGSWKRNKVYKMSNGDDRV